MARPFGCGAVGAELVTLRELKGCSLIQRTRQGDLEAFNGLVLACQDQVFQHALWMLGEPEAAEEITQETFLLAYRQMRAYRDGDFHIWLLSIASRLCLEALRRWENHPFPPSKKVDVDADDDSVFGGLDQTEPLEGNVSQEELEMRVREGLKQLAPNLRAVLILVDLLDFDYRQAAEILGISLGNTRNRLARARVQIRG